MKYGIGLRPRLLEAIIDSSGDAIISETVNGIITSWNVGAATIFGYTADEMIGKSMFDLFPPDRKNEEEGILEQLRSGEKSRHFETVRLRKDGTKIDVSMTISSISEIDGTIIGISKIARDITERRYLEKQLKLRSAAAEFATDGVIIADAQATDFPIIYVSHAFLVLTGYREDEVLGRNCRFLQGAETDLEVVALLKKALINGLSFSQEILNYRKNGETFWNLLRIESLRDDTGNLQYFVSTQTDITKRKIAEQALVAEKERLQVTLHSIGDGVITTDAKGKIEFMNPIAETLTGWLTGEAKGKPLKHIFKIVTEDTHLPVQNPVTLCLKQQRTIGLPDNVVLLNRQGVHYAIQDSAAPIRTPEGNILGAVLVFQDVTKARGLIQQIHHQACHDKLTGLLNRYEFEQRLIHALKSAKDEDLHHALCFLDLDNFKIVNDTAGHIAGDALLMQIAHLLGSQLRARDSLARLGGDEFSLLLECCPLDQAFTITEKLLNTIRSLRFTWNDNIYEIGVSIGIVSITPNSDTAEQLLSQADVACYAAKDQGRNQVVIYHAEDGASVHRHSEMLQAAGLREALEKDRFCLYAQPIKALADDKNNVTYYELLVRMRDKNGEILMPGTFIPAAERYNLMSAIDRWVIKTALDQYSMTFGTNSMARIAVNLSGNSLTDSTLLGFVIEQLNKNSVLPDRICFEITETAAISNLTHATRLIKELKSSGCSVALDDFGSGLSSFNYLKQFPINYLKIDGSFMRGVVDDPIDQAMVESINHIGHVMGIQTIAEWVENDTILDQLKSIGVDYVQGYAIGLPIPLTDMLKD